MSEYQLQIMAFAKVIWAGVFSLLYGLGGISNKWLRRYVGAFWMGGGLWVFGAWKGSFSPLLLLYAPLLCASLHLGYGGTNNVFVKIRKRAVYGIALGVSAMPICFVSGMWALFGLHCFLCFMASVLLGVFNFSGSARDEETLIATLSTMLVLFLI